MTERDPTPTHGLICAYRPFIGLRRFLIPQRDALLRVAAAKVSWLPENERNWLREVADQTTRLLETLEADRDQAAVTQEELLQRLSEKTERRVSLLCDHGRVPSPGCSE